ncbi:cobalt transporter [Nonlabens sp. YIK11]|uniref:cation diffusion facilitator family transporter n=1 Tax=Nonlabens sp. YIK11 TaxID=1453349 RepID=UPI0006DBFD70|nr:cation diffusion facilitator family transporter [Nonlabens sp. YIK11]KQC32355.1 cobalt transporter [Nonlabens sp. YIK11]
MGHNHAHDHNSTGNIRFAFFLNLGFTILEIIGGIYTNSIAIVSDAVHDLGDTLSLGSSWYLQHKSEKKSDQKFSYGYRRLSLLGAFINGVVLILGSAYVIYEAVKRLQNPEPSDAQGMIIFALIGVVVNGYAAYKLTHGTSMNEKVMSWHMIEDVLGWAAILIAAIVLYFYENQYIDPVLSLLITAYILFNAFKRLRETVYLFLQGIPLDVDLEQIKSGLLNLDHVCSLHHTHIWSQDGQHHVFSTHVILENVETLEQMSSVKKKILESLDAYDFEHLTIEIEVNQQDCSVRILEK